MRFDEAQFGSDDDDNDESANVEWCVFLFIFRFCDSSKLIWVFIGRK